MCFKPNTVCPNSWYITQSLYHLLSVKKVPSNHPLLYPILLYVLEHVIDPFKCSQELQRVTTKGGKIWCAVPFLQPYHGYPHHYYNMTFQGLTNLFSQYCDVQLLDTRPYALPIDVLKELLTKYMSVLPEAEKSKFSKLRIRDISNSKDSELKEKSWVKKFPEWWNKYFCSVNTVIATKNSNN